MKSKVNPNTPRGSSMRTTIPESVVETLGIKKGDTLDWIIEHRENSMVAVVRKT